MHKLRRLRKSAEIRELRAQTRLSVKDLIMPYFVIEGKNKKVPIRALPGISRLSVDNLVSDVRELKKSGVSAALLFGVARHKDEQGTESYDPNGVLQQAVAEIKKNVKGMVVITDVCMCGYTTHGHCGIVKGTPPAVDNDATLEILAGIALSHARSGADFVAPSAMMDGQVRAIREALDKNNCETTGIFSYSAKYCSNFYGPFREALDSAPQFGDRRTYQMDSRNSDEALREIEQDIREGADIVMVKPALAYLDIIRRAGENCTIPLAAYNVSGEYAMVKAAAEKGMVDERGIVIEILTSIKRAGADLIITYHAKEAAKWIQD